MDELIGEAIEVERAADSPRPVRFRWRNEVHEVVEIDREWVDTGYGDLPRRSRRWFNRRHRRCFVVRDATSQASGPSVATSSVANRPLAA